jgi:hypothetical protein
MRPRSPTGTWISALVLSAPVTACHPTPQGSSSTGASTAAATSARTPPDKPSEEAESPQIRMAREEGKAYQASLAYMAKKVAVGGGGRSTNGACRLKPAGCPA